MLMHHRDDIFYVVRACIVMHNMMIKVRVDEEGEMEDSSFYDILAVEEDADGKAVPNENGNEVNGSIGMNYSYSMDCKEDFEFAQKRWKELYDIGEQSDCKML